MPTAPITFEGYTADELMALPASDFHALVLSGRPITFRVAIAERYARMHGLHSVQWLVYALACARPNADLRAMLERRGFEPYDLRGTQVLRRVKGICSSG